VNNNNDNNNNNHNNNKVVRGVRNASFGRAIMSCLVCPHRKQKMNDTQTHTRTQTRTPASNETYLGADGLT